MPDTRSIVYIDGFNLYKGAIEGGPNRWLNLQSYFEKIRKDDDIQIINYFTALIYGTGRDNQKTYIKALETLPKLRVIHGFHKPKSIMCRAKSCSSNCDRRFDTFEEKRTDVNIAIYMLRDAFMGNCDRQILVSGDSDFVSPIEMIREMFPAIKTTVYIPAKDDGQGRSSELRQAAHKNATLPILQMRLARFDRIIPHESGDIIAPRGWL